MKAILHDFFIREGSQKRMVLQLFPQHFDFFPLILKQESHQQWIKQNTISPNHQRKSKTSAD